MQILVNKSYLKIFLYYTPLAFQQRFVFLKHFSENRYIKNKCSTFKYKKKKQVLLV